MTSHGGHTYTYNAEDVRIRNLCSDEDTTYTYNTNAKLSMLLCKTTGGVTTKYVYGKGLIGEEVNSTFKTYHFDCRGSTIAITDANGNIADTFAYDTYGKLLTRTGTIKETEQTVTTMRLGRAHSGTCCHRETPFREQKGLLKK